MQSSGETATLDYLYHAAQAFFMCEYMLTQSHGIRWRRPKFSLCSLRLRAKMRWLLPLLLDFEKNRDMKPPEDFYLLERSCHLSLGG